MNTDQSQRGSFEERLLAELRSLVVAQPSPAEEKRPGRPRVPVAHGSRRGLVLAGGAVALIAVGVATGVPFLTGGAAPAYAVNANDDGTVTVEISSLKDAAGLQSKLREAGIRAVVQYLPPGKACRQPWLTPAALGGDPGQPGTEPAIRGGVVHTADGRTRFTISRNLPADRTLVIMTQASSTGPSEATSLEAIAVVFAQGEVGPCEIVDAPAGSQPFGAPPPGAGQIRTRSG
jgi:hypothetical protein